MVEHNPSEISRKISESSWFRWLTILSVLGALLGLAFAIPSVRERIFNEGRHVDLRLDNEIPVLGINRQIQGLNVTYEGTDLLETDQQLVAIRVVLQNVGGVSITPSDISQSDPLGFAIKNGEIIRLTRISGSSDHLRRLSKPKVVGRELILENNIILDEGDEVAFDLLILAESDAKIQIIPKGKVAGVEEIQFVNRSEPEPEPTWKTAFSGTVWVQLVRILSYTLIFILVIAFIAGVFSAIDSAKRSVEKRKRRLKSIEYIVGSTMSGSEEFKFVVDKYVDEGSELIDVLAKSLSRDGKLTLSGRRKVSVESDEDLFREELLSIRSSSYFGVFRFSQEAAERGFMSDPRTPTEALSAAIRELAEML